MERKKAISPSTVDKNSKESAVLSSTDMVEDGIMLFAKAIPSNLFMPGMSVSACARSIAPTIKEKKEFAGENKVLLNRVL